MRFSMALIGVLLMNMTFLVFAETIPGLTWSSSIEAEREYDSSVSLEQIDRVSHESDYANQLKWAAAGQWQANKSLQFDASYNGRHRVYDQFSEFDLDQHHLAFTSKYTYADVGYSYRYDHARAKVDGDSFLKFSQSTLAIDKLFKSRYFIRGAVSSSKNDFSQLSERNANAILVAMDALVFFYRGNSHIGFNISVEDETAQANLYDNTTESLSVTYQYKFTQAVLPTTFISSVQYSRKRYDTFAVDAAGDEDELLIERDSSDVGNATRVDNRIQLSAGLELALNDWLVLMVKADYSDNASNYSPVDQREHLMSLGIKASF